MSTRTKTCLAILLAVLGGLLLGSCTAMARIRQHPWLEWVETPPPPGSGQVAVDQDEFDFGKLDSKENGKHEFVLTNRGDNLLTLTPGATSCTCTVSEIKVNKLPPGQSTKVLVSWRSKGHVGPFEQTVTIVTSDPLRPELTLTIKGEYTQPVYADPDELTFNQIPGTEPVTRETRILCNSPKQQLKIQGHNLSDPGLGKFFQVDCLPLAADELRKYKGVTSGVLVRVTVKSGLPLGSFRQTITLHTNLTVAPEVEIPLFGSVGEVSLIGPGWNSESGVLDLGVVGGGSFAPRKLIVLARGAKAKEMKFKVARVEPSFLKVNLGKTTVADTGTLLTELLIEIPVDEILKSKTPANYMGGGNGKLGEILLETTQPQVHAVRIRVRFAVLGGR